jgi:hypothetical protein
VEVRRRAVSVRDIRSKQFTTSYFQSFRASSGSVRSYLSAGIRRAPWQGQKNFCEENRGWANILAGGSFLTRMREISAPHDVGLAPPIVKYGALSREKEVQNALSSLSSFFSFLPSIFLSFQRLPHPLLLFLIPSSNFHFFI